MDPINRYSSNQEDIDMDGLRVWFRNIVMTVVTIGRGLWITLRYWLSTYKPERKTFTEQFEYPELPVPVAPRYRGFHRFDLTTCIACDQCATDLN